MEHREPEDEKRQEPQPEQAAEREPDAGTPASPFPPVQAYRPPRMTAFRSPVAEERRPGQAAQQPFQQGGPAPAAGTMPGADPRSTSGSTPGGTPEDDPWSSHEPEPEPPRPVPPQAYVPPAGPPAPPRGRSILGPVVLILLGLFFLGQSLGWVDWSIWEVIWRFWPAWLIVIGLDMLIGRRSRWGGLLAVAIVVTLVGGLFYATAPFRSSLQSQPMGAEHQIDQPLEGATTARVEVNPAVSQLTLRGGQLGDRLVQGTVVPLSSEALEESRRVDGGVAYYRIGSTVRGPFGAGRGQGRWDLVLTDAVPIDLTLETGVGESDVDLSQLRVTDLEVETGVGEMTLTLPAQGPVNGRVSAGVGEITIRVPEGQAARIQVETGLGAVSVGEGFEMRDGYYVTPNYSDTANAIDLTVTGGVGEVRLEMAD